MWTCIHMHGERKKRGAPFFCSEGGPTKKEAVGRGTFEGPRPAEVHTIAKVVDKSRPGQERGTQTPIRGGLRKYFPQCFSLLTLPKGPPTVLQGSPEITAGARNTAVRASAARAVKRCICVPLFATSFRHVQAAAGANVAPRDGRHSTHWHWHCFHALREHDGAWMSPPGRW